MDNGPGITVEIDADLKPVVPEFLKKRQSECALIEALLAADQLDEIRSIAHRMKGSGGSYGFDEISEIGEAIETAVHTGDAQGIRAAVARLEAYLAGVKVTYVRD